MRVACVHAPQIALQAILRRDPELRQDAVVLVEAVGTDADRARVVALTRAAHQAGVRRGMTVGQAKAEVDSRQSTVDSSRASRSGASTRSTVDCRLSTRLRVAVAAAA